MPSSVLCAAVNINIIICNSIFWTLSSVCILLHFGSWIFFRLQVKRSPGLRLAEPGGPTARVFVLPFSSEDGRRSSFRNIILLKYRRWIMSKKMLLQIITHHHQNPLDIINFITLYSARHGKRLRSWKPLNVEMYAHGGFGLDSSGSR
jgi:hypothetical protein